ncbi:MAG: trigger factor, partial [Nocardioidaceae bacterium]
EVPFEELKPSLDAAYKKIAGQINVPGFRRGKVPPQVVDQRVGRGVVLDEAVNEALPQLYFQALEENQIQALSQPDIEVVSFEDGGEFAFAAEVDVRPDIEVPEYEGIQAEVQDAELTDDDVDAQLQTLRERFGTLKTVERPAAVGDFVSIDLSASMDGEPIEEAQASGMSYKVGSDMMLDGLDEALTGLTAGESKTFASRLVGGELAGEEVDVEVTVQSVKEQELPDLDDEFAQTASEFDTVDELTADLRSRLERGRRLDQAAEARDSVLAKLLEMTDIPVPDSAVAEETKARKDTISEQLEQVGMDFERYLEVEEQTEEEFDVDLDKRVRDTLASRFLLDELAKQKQLSVAEGELTEHLVRRAQRSGMQPDAYAEQIVQGGRIPELVSEVVRAKALQLVVEAAQVTDTSGRVIELKRLKTDGTFFTDEELAASTASDDVASDDVLPS